MIPFPIVPLKGLSVLVTRPSEQASALGRRIQELGGNAILFPAVAIEPIAAEAPGQEFDWVIFISANAVAHGLDRVRRGDRTRVAAIGKTTAAALEARKVRPDAMPENGVTSEALLQHAAFATIEGKTVLIVKGVGGRELLHDALVQRGAHVVTLDVYRRIRPSVDPAAVEDLVRRWREERVDVMTATSVEILDNVIAMLGLPLVGATPIVVASERIAEAARGRGLTGTCLLARGADDESLVGAIAAWHSRAR